MEIERKWVVNKLPDLSQIKAVPFERHFLYSAAGIEIRIQQNGDKYEFERKVEKSSLSREETKFEITREEFAALKKFSIKALFRDIYLLSDDGTFSLKIYKGEFAGLIRAEVEFNSEKAALAYKPLSWFGKEITNTDLGRDKNLLKLSHREFAILLNKYK